MKAFFNALLENVFGWLDRQKHDADLRAAGRLEAERDAAAAGIIAQQEAAAIAAHPPSQEDILKRLDEGKI